MGRHAAEPGRILAPATSRVNGVLALHGEMPLRENQISRLLGLYPTATRTALHALERAGVARRVRRAGHNEWELDAASPYADIARRMALVDLGLRGLLSDEARVLGIYAFGSVPAGTALPESDLDIFIVGKVDQHEVTSAFRPVEKVIGRTIDAVIRSASETRDLVDQGDAFIRAALAGQRLWGTWS